MSDTTIAVPEDLADELYARKQRGETYADVIRRLLEADADETPADDRDTTPTATAEPAAAPEPEDGLDAIVDDVAGEVLPGSGAKLDARREALRAVVEYLRDHGTAEPADFREEVYPDHPARYTTGKDPARSWWKNAMYPGLGAVAERTDRVEKADTTGRWSFVEDDGGP